MSEEKPTFKVTDRRLFNADGTPREDVERPVEPATEATTGAVETPAAASNDAPATASAASAEEAHAAPASSDEARPVTGDAAGGDTRSARGEQGGEAAANDPNAFGELVMALAQPAAMALGMIEHPAMAGRDLDPALAKHYIDLLGTLQQKTNGNLSLQEEQLLASLLAELRMQFVSISNARPGGGGVVGARGFSGSDITGGT